MKRTLTLVIGVVVVATLFVLGVVPHRQAILGVVPTVQAQEGCTLASLQGVYLFTHTEASPSDRPDLERPFAAAGLRTFDGEGNISILSTASRNGVITRRGVDPGTYTLDSDCTGTMTTMRPTTDAHWDMFIAEDGSEGLAVRTDEGKIGTLTFKKR